MWEVDSFSFSRQKYQKNRNISCGWFTKPLYSGKWDQPNNLVSLGQQWWQGWMVPPSAPCPLDSSPFILTDCHRYYTLCTIYSETRPSFFKIVEAEGFCFHFPFLKWKWAVFEPFPLLHLRTTSSTEASLNFSLLEQKIGRKVRK